MRIIPNDKQKICKDPLIGKKCKYHQSTGIVCGSYIDLKGGTGYIMAVYSGTEGWDDFVPGDSSILYSDKNNTLGYWYIGEEDIID